MTTNLGSRSVSISSPGTERKMLNGGDAGAGVGSVQGGVRSASIGSSFFQQNTSNFFSPQDVATSSSSLEDELSKRNGGGASGRTAGSDIDIVGALNTLDLDEDFDIKGDSSRTNRKMPPVVSRDEVENTNSPFSQGLYGNNYQQFHPYMTSQQGSLTPNPSMNAFAQSSFGNINTPTSTWSNNFIPASAPTFFYGGSTTNADELAMSIKPFELPEDKKFVNNGGKVNDIHYPFSTPPPHPVDFGGILDSSIQFGVPPYGASEQLPRGERSSPESDVDGTGYSESGSSLSSSMTPKSFSRNSSTVRPPNGQYIRALDGQYMKIIDPKVGEFESKDYINGHFLNENASVSVPNVLPDHLTEGVWGQPGKNNQLRQSHKGNYIDNRGSHASQYNNSGSNRYGRNRSYGNEAMNIHRKMYNNRRRGDDASKYANAKLEDFTGEIYSLCKDQHGCRFLQKQLDLGKEVAEKKAVTNVLPNDISATMIFNEIYLKIVELMTDPFGNYLIQKLFENVSTDQRIILVKNAAPEFIRIGLDPHGTRALQKLIECVTTEEESKLIVDSLSPHIVSLARDLNGNHVVQKCLQKLNCEEIQFIFDAASYHCNEVATHRHGCCVLQRCLDYGNKEQRKQLSTKIAENATNLSLDPFGNYVVQYVFSRGDETSIKIITDHIKSNMISLSLHKFGSNVIERSLRIKGLTDTLIAVLLDNRERFAEMLNDSYGNYVLQTSLDVAKQPELLKLAQSLQPLLPNIKNTPHGRRIMTKIQCISL